MPVIKSSDDLDYDHLHEQYANKIFNDYEPEKLPGRTYESIKISNDGLTIKLIDKYQRDLLSIVHGNIKTYHGTDYFEIIWTFSKLQQQGYLTYLFKILTEELKHKVLSDKNHTSPGSKEFWMAQIRRRNFNIYRINLNTNFKRKANGFKENEIWTIGNTLTDAYLDNFNYFIEDNMTDEQEPLFLDDVEDGSDLDIDYQDHIKSQPNNLEDFNTKSMEAIRLIAQKYRS